jgi:coiled-coil domain-containing protein 39
MSMEEREKEIKVHRDILESEKQAAEEERHKLAVELQLRQQKVKNLRIKFEGLVQRNKSSSGDVEADGEHTQAYFVIKAAQEREELQRFGDELDGKIRKSEKEIKALSNTLDHLKVRNRHYRDKFKEGADGADLERKQILEDQCRHASETLFKKRRELQNLQQTFDSGSRDLMQIRNDKNQLFAKRDEVNNQYSALDQELAQLITKIQNQSRAHDAKLNNVKAVRGADFEQSPTYM